MKLTALFIQFENQLND